MEWNCSCADSAFLPRSRLIVRIIIMYACVSCTIDEYMHGYVHLLSDESTGMIRILCCIGPRFRPISKQYQRPGAQRHHNDGSMTLDSNRGRLTWHIALVTNLSVCRLVCLIACIKLCPSQSCHISLSSVLLPDNRPKPGFL